MEGLTNIQVTNLKKREAYENDLQVPLLMQIARMHRISIRDFAEIFGISKSHAEDILKHRVMPTLEVSIKIARYWECTVEELFGWRVDDDGMRRPLLIDIGNGRLVRLKAGDKSDATMARIGMAVRMFRRQREEIQALEEQQNTVL